MSALATTTARTFTYEEGFTYATDPATLVNVKVGDVVRVESRYKHEPDSYTSAVTRVGFDEFGVYLGTSYVRAETYRGITEHYRDEMQASTILHKVTIVCAGEPIPGGRVDYFGTISSAHGEARIAGVCRCDMGDDSPDGHYVLHTQGYALEHVDRAHFRIL